jgi:hypothetical protein
VSIGVFNPCPFVIGEGPTPLESAYQSLREAVGAKAGIAGGKSFADGGIEDARRYCRALVIAAAASLQEAALAEFFAITTTYRLREWEDILHLPHQDDAEAGRQAAAAVAYAKLYGDLPRLREQLRARFDPSINLTLIAREDQVTTMIGKTLADRTGTVYFGTRGVQIAPNYSTAWVLNVSWPGTRTPDELALISRVVSRVIPSWVDFQITGSTGFVLGTSLLGQTTLT